MRIYSYLQAGLILVLVFFSVSLCGQVLNGSFEINGEATLDHWTISWNLGESYEDAAPGGDNWCLKLEAGNLQGYFPVYAYQVIPEIQNGEIWEVTVWVRQHSNITFASLYWRIFKFDGSQIDLSASETYSETWTQLSVTDTILIEMGDSVAVVLDSGVTGGPSVNWSYFDLVEAEMIWGVGISQHEISQINQTKCTNYPNPFNPTTSISFSIPEKSNVELTIFNIKGQKVKTLVNSNLDQDNHSVIWNGTDENRKPVSSGIYLYKLKTDNFEKTKKMILLK
ncbi:MAG: T9SS type A sorting domain-containing protein [Candidatus Cloacimonetes bacterium]|nr:T9SS type A sorting domain-containing protein [Candidatus Cloacimonadota bacterium]